MITNDNELLQLLSSIPKEITLQEGVFRGVFHLWYCSDGIGCQKGWNASYLEYGEPIPLLTSKEDLIGYDELDPAVAIRKLGKILEENNLL